MWIRMIDIITNHFIMNESRTATGTQALDIATLGVAYSATPTSVLGTLQSTSSRGSIEMRQFLDCLSGGHADKIRKVIGTLIQKRKVTHDEVIAVLVQSGLYEPEYPVEIRRHQGTVTELSALLDGTSYVFPGKSGVGLRNGSDTYNLQQGHAYAVTGDMPLLGMGSAMAITVRNDDGSNDWQACRIGNDLDRNTGDLYLDRCTVQTLFHPRTRHGSSAYYLTIPHGYSQERFSHFHPHARYGLVHRGAGLLHYGRDGDVIKLEPGKGFVLAAGETHWFETKEQLLNLFVVHPVTPGRGPSDNDHPVEAGTFCSVEDVTEHIRKTT